MLAVAGLLTTSCEKNNLKPTFAGAEVPVTISASMECTTTRAIDDYGKGENINRAILEVYTTGDDAKLYKRMVVPVENLKANFELRLVSSHNYDFVVWADKANAETVDKEEMYSSDEGTEYDLYYETSNGLQSVTLMNPNTYVGNNEDRDAFCGTINKTIEGSSSIDLSLLRPFGQINVSTNLTDIEVDNLPTKVKITYDPSTPVANTLNVLTGETSGTTELEWSAAAEVIDIADVETDAEGIHLSTDYILAPKNGQALLDFTMEFINENGTQININDNFKNIPVQRNYRTNISGELLISEQNITVTIIVTPGLDGEIGKETKSVAIDDLEAIMEIDKAVNEVLYAVNDEVATNTTIIIPDLNISDAIRSIDLKRGIANGATLTITTESPLTADDDPKVLYLTVPKGTEGDVVIELPNTTVYLNGEYKGVFTASTAINTLIVEQNASLNSLVIRKGNVEIYGKVTSISQHADNAEITKVTIYEGGELTNMPDNCDEFIIYGGDVNDPDAVLPYIMPGTEVIEESAFENNKDITKIIIPASVKEIQQYAFRSCSNVTEIDFSKASDGLVVGFGAFETSGISELYIPATVASLGANAFVGCPNLTTVEIYSKNNSSSFNNCASLETVIIGSERIGYMMFDSNSNLKNLTLKEGVKEIGKQAFARTSITSVSIPSTVKNISHWAFWRCASLEAVTFAEASTVETIGYQVFTETKLVEATLPASLKEIGFGAFSSCPSFTTLTMLATTPPVLAEPDMDSYKQYYDLFWGNEQAITVYVPDGSVDSYKEEVTTWKPTFADHSNVTIEGKLTITGGIYTYWNPESIAGSYPKLSTNGLFPKYPYCQFDYEVSSDVVSFQYYVAVANGGVYNQTDEFMLETLKSQNVVYPATAEELNKIHTGWGWDADMVIVTVAIDKDGNYGKPQKFIFKFEKDNANSDMTGLTPFLDSAEAAI